MRASADRPAAGPVGILGPDSPSFDRATRIDEAPLATSPPDRLTGVRRRICDKIATFAADLRRVVGMPDYQAYVRHLRLCHPDSPVPSEREFFNRYVTARYGDGPTRCC